MGDQGTTKKEDQEPQKRLEVAVAATTGKVGGESVHGKGQVTLMRDEGAVCARDPVKEKWTDIRSTGRFSRGRGL